ncbi:hypothetical protein BKK79_36640 (plasmid) [Cupriavidus sp. USMAA2-4]|uniref:hypothetical protein n=1 Tax=Cupriavidus sp. USMAA2-4 TaxID=876364 RepID=UPI0008A6A744|nr:hypothetical protein [Cupriavidus sp. USMAA2-4]AOY97478.1 hypothetical protein BKK79_36640 [Cupriavidus sp. USMAA2-4]
MSKVQNVASLDLEASQVLLDYVSKVNRALLDLLRTAAASNIPCVPELIGVPPEVLSQFSKASIQQVISLSQVGFPLWEFRFRDPRVVQSLIDGEVSAHTVTHQLLVDLGKSKKD